jgi:hypothetical protein
MFKAKVAAAALVLASLAPGLAVMAAAEAHARPYTDTEEIYLEVLHEKGINSGHGDDGLLRAGYAVCQELRKGFSEINVIRRLFEDNDGLNSGGAGYLLGAAQASFCPETIDGRMVA